MSRSVVTRANFILFAVLIVMLAVVGGLTWDRQHDTRDMRAWVAHTNAVLVALGSLHAELLQAESGQRAFLITGESDSLTRYDEALSRIGLLEGQLQALTSDNADQQARLRTLVPLIQRKSDELARTVQLRRTAGLEAAVRSGRALGGHAMTGQIATLLDQMQAEEQSLLQQRQASADSGSLVVLWLVAGLTLAAIAMMIVAGYWLTHAWVVADRAEAEQRALAVRLRTSLDSLSQGVAVFDHDWQLADWNDCFRVLLDVAATELRAGMPYAALAARAGELLENEDEVRHGRQHPDEPVVTERVRTDGHQIELRRTAMPDGGFVLTLSDMTKRAQAEAVLRESQKMQAIGQLTGGVAHDFNNLLTVILGSMEFIRSNPDDREKVLSRAERASWAAQRGATLTRQLLAFARKQPLAPAALDLTTVLPDMVPLLRRTLGEQIDVRYVETAGLWPAMADAAQLESALLNLALNARDAMPGGGRLTIELGNKVLDADYAINHAEVAAGDYTMLAVSDTGHGMAPSVIAHAFEPFFTTKPDGKGTGLGLAMVFGFVKQSGGHIKIYSEVGEGTTVRLYLPRAIGARLAPPRAVGPIELPHGSSTILVVEDEPAVREITSSMLRELGYRVLEAKDGEDGLLVFGANTDAVDLVVTDVVLPGKVRGREMADRIRSVRSDVAVLFVSGYTENSIVHNGRLDDGVQLLSKPFTRERLAQKVAEVLGARGGAGTGGNVVELRGRRGD